MPMTNKEKKNKLTLAFDRYNWSLRAVHRGEAIYLSVFNGADKHMGDVILSEHGGYYRCFADGLEPSLQKLFYSLVDGAIGTKED